MTVICKGAEFNSFMRDPAVWPKGAWFDDVYAEVDGKRDPLDYSFRGDDLLPAAATIAIQSGEYHPTDGAGSTFYCFETKLKDWLDVRSSTTIAIEIDNDQLEARRAEIASLAGVRIID